VKYEELLGGSQFTRKDRECVEFVNDQILAWTHFDLMRIVQYLDVVENVVGAPSPMSILDAVLNAFPGPQRDFPRLARCCPNCGICTEQWRDVIEVAHCILQDWFSALPFLLNYSAISNLGRRVYQTGAVLNLESLDWTRQWTWVRGPASQMAAAQLFDEPEDPALKQ